jgi:hypothetical protein
MTKNQQLELANNKMQKAMDLFAEASELLKNLRKSDRISEGEVTLLPPSRVIE